MRIRQIKPSFWTDPLIQKKLSAIERLIYIGLWMLADDAGWLRMDIDEIAVSLLPYEPVEDREAIVEATIAKLVDLGRLERTGCRHGFLPTLRNHQSISAEKAVYTIEREHQRRCPAAPAGPLGSPTGADGIAGELDRYGKERDAKERNRDRVFDENEGPTQLRPTKRPR